VYTADDDGERLVLGQGRLRRGAPEPAERLDLEELRDRCDGPVLDADTCYARLAEGGMVYGPALRAIERLHTGSRQAVARLRLPAHLAGAAGESGAESGFVLHPSLLDAALQTAAGLFADDGGAPGGALPFALRELQVWGATPSTGWAVVRFAPDDRPGTVRHLDIDLCDDHGDVRVRLRGYSVRGPAERTTPSPVSTADEAYLLELVEAIAKRELSADDFKRSLL
jgi:hypothetical protein